MRLALIIALTAVVAGVGATTAHALAFSEAICPGEGTTEADPKTCPSGLVGAGSFGSAKRPQWLLAGGRREPREHGLVFRFRATAGAHTVFERTLQRYRQRRRVPGCSAVTMRDHCWSLVVHRRQAHGQRDLPDQPLIRVSGSSRTPFRRVPPSVLRTPRRSTRSSSRVSTHRRAQPLLRARSTWSSDSGHASAGAHAGERRSLGHTDHRRFVHLPGARPRLDASRKHAQTYALTVRQPLKVTPAKPLATPPLSTAWEAGVAFTAKLTPSGGSGTYTFTLGTGTLPTGLALAPTGPCPERPARPGCSVRP